VLHLLAVLLLAQAPSGLRLEDATFRQFEDGPPYEQSYRPGEQVFLDVRVAGYGRTEDENPSLKLKWTFRAVDGSGRLLEPATAGKLETVLNAQDTDYRPRARFAASIPPFALEGLYKVDVALTDEVAGKTVESSYPFRVRGKQLPAGGKLEAGNSRFYRQEDDPAPLTMASYRPGSQVWLRFDLQGFSLTAANAFRVNYGVVVSGPDGKQFLKQDPAAAEAGQPAYPQAYVPATFVIQLPPKALPGEYRVAIIVRDLQAEREQTTELSFRVE
jgi:hypothetical protein